MTDRDGMADLWRRTRDKTGTDYGIVTDYSTGEPVRPATHEEWWRTRGPRPRGLPDATGMWADDDGRVVYVNCGEGAISRHTGRPAGATGVHWTAHGYIECFARLDFGKDRHEPSAAPGEFVSEPALTGEDDCACDWHTWARNRGGEARVPASLNLGPSWQRARALLSAELVFTPAFRSAARVPVLLIAPFERCRAGSRTKRAAARTGYLSSMPRLKLRPARSSRCGCPGSTGGRHCAYRSQAAPGARRERPSVTDQAGRPCHQRHGHDT